MRRVLLIDNYDSFTWNLVQALRSLGAEVLVHRNDCINAAEAWALEATHLVISPGPGHPSAAGNMPEILREGIERLPVLGVCLGHQALAHVLGGQVSRAPRLMHGKSSQVYHDNRGLYLGLPNPFEAARYHSLIVDEQGLPACLRISAYTSAGEIMGVRHTSKPVAGVQFHPESILTAQGSRLLANFLDFDLAQDSDLPQGGL